ncbi:MAG: hypothetical protein MI749_01900 [Desulfovibrionales bacterium]|nr:hypothetical protein [Desulfovibrionales bacterium]
MTDHLQTKGLFRWDIQELAPLGGFESTFFHLLAKIDLVLKWICFTIFSCPRRHGGHHAR